LSIAANKRKGESPASKHTHKSKFKKYSTQ